MPRGSPLRRAILAALFVLPRPGWGDEAPTDLGVSATVGVASSYYWRGALVSGADPVPALQNELAFEGEDLRFSAWTSHFLTQRDRYGGADEIDLHASWRAGAALGELELGGVSYVNYNLPTLQFQPELLLNLSGGERTTFVVQPGLNNALGRHLDPETSKKAVYWVGELTGTVGSALPFGAGDGGTVGLTAFYRWTGGKVVDSGALDSGLHLDLDVPFTVRLAAVAGAHWAHGFEGPLDHFWANAGLRLQR